MTDFKCPFCGSDKIRIEQPFMRPKMEGANVSYEHQTTFCCYSQKKNQTYLKKRFNPRGDSHMTSDDASKL